MMMQVRLVTALSGRRNLQARSTTGTTLPRRLITPRMKAGVEGTRVTTPCSMISRTRSTAIAYSPPASENVRYCARATDLAAVSLVLVVMLFSMSKPPEFALGRAAHRGRAPGRGKGDDGHGRVQRLRFG